MKQRTLSFIEALQKDNPGVEAVALWQKGETVIDHRFVRPAPRQIYSHTKSFIATAVGIAIDEGKLSLTDKLLDFFPEYVSVVTDERVKNITLRHLLTMTSGFGREFLMSVERRQGEGFPDYLAYMLSKPLADEPGSRYVYSNADSHMAGCMVQKAVGENLQKFCYRRIFEPMGIGFPSWETDPDGTAFGGSGLYLDILDMMKLGVLYLNKGSWNGKQIVSEAWVSEAGRKQIDTGYGSEWMSGYGYQFWIVSKREGAFRADGAYGQVSIVLPDSNAVLATQCSEDNDVHRFAEMLRYYTID